MRFLGRGRWCGMLRGRETFAMLRGIVHLLEFLSGIDLLLAFQKSYPEGISGVIVLEDEGGMLWIL